MNRYSFMLVALLISLSTLVAIVERITPDAPRVLLQVGSERVIQGSNAATDNYHDAVFTLDYPDVFTSVEQVILSFSTRPLTATTNLLSIGVPSTPMLIDTEYYFAVTASVHYPSDIHLIIDGIDRTAELGGAWNANAGNEPVRVKVDITRLVNDVYAEHQIVFTAGIKQDADAAVPGNPPHPRRLANTSNGMIEALFTIIGAATLN